MKKKREKRAIYHLCQENANCKILTIFILHLNVHLTTDSYWNVNCDCIAAH